MKQFVIASALAVAALSAQAAPKKKAAPVVAQTVEIDRDASVVNWEGTKKVGDKHVGTVKFQSGRIVLEKDTVKSGEFYVDLNTIADTDIKDPGYMEKLNGHLKSEDFFDVKKFPTASFKLLSAKPIAGSKDGFTHTITGELTIKGKTEKIDFPAQITKTADKIEAKAEVKFDRIKFDVKYNSDKLFKNLGDKIINDEVKINVVLVAPLKK